MVLVIAKRHSRGTTSACRNMSKILRNMVERITICGPNRNSYSKTDHSATFMRIKKNYMVFPVFYWASPFFSIPSQNSTHFTLQNHIFQAYLAAIITKLLTTPLLQKRTVDKSTQYDPFENTYGSCCNGWAFLLLLLGTKLCRLETWWGVWSAKPHRSHQYFRL